MKYVKLLFLLLPVTLNCTACTSGKSEANTSHAKMPKKSFTLYDYYSNDSELNRLTDSIFTSLTPAQRLSRMIITSAGELGKPQSTVASLVQKEAVGGVLFLKGKSQSHKTFIDSLEKLSTLPLFYSIDAEPSLIPRRMPDVSQSFKPAAEIADSLEAYQSGNNIGVLVKNLGFNWNYAPVIDLSTGNEAIKTRSFGSDQNDVITKAKAFVEGTRAAGVIDCIKHFPGHGLVSGDTHKKTVFIDGELKEVNTYKPLIEAGAISVMVAHITVENNAEYGTDGKPASCSRKIVTDLLRNELNFKGIIITDAMNMAAAVNEGESAPLTAAKAGNDMILMPPNEEKLLNEMLAAYNADEALQAQWDASVKRILKLAVCTGMFDPQSSKQK